MAKRRLFAVAYVSNEGHIGFRRNDVLICDASDRAIKTGETSAHLLQSLCRKGVELRSISDLHAKVAVFGRYALIGSCNLSVSSARYLTELALLSDRKQVVAQATAFIYSLRESSEEIDDGFLRRILKIKVHPFQRCGAKRKVQQASFGGKAWIVSVQELGENSFQKEQPFVDKGKKKADSLVVDRDSTVSWIRLTGKARFRTAAKSGDTVIQIWKSFSGKRTTVFAGRPIVYRQDVAHWTRFYISESEDSQSLSWERFKKESKKLGLSHVSKDSVRELTPKEILLFESILE